MVRLRGPSVPAGANLLLVWRKPEVAGQLQRNAQASAHAVSKAYLSAMLPYDRTSYGETEPDAASVRVARVVNSVERFEDLLAFTRRYSGSLVVDR